jgi:hypothetical protein
MSVRTVGTATVPPALVAGLATLEDILRRPGLTVLDVIVEDEYTHDVIVAAGAAYLVFDTT